MKRTTHKKKRSTLLQNLALLLITCLFLFIILEVALRIITVNPRPLTKYHDTYVYTFNPSTTQDLVLVNNTVEKRSFNEHGWYGPISEYEYEKKKPYRVLVIGDSFTSQLSLANYDAIYSEQIENSTVDMVTIGVGSYSWDNELKVLEQKGDAYDPDIVVFAWFANDIPDLGRENVFSIRNGTLVDNTPRTISATRKLLFWCQNTFYTCGHFANLVFVKYSLQLNKIFTIIGISDIKRDASLNYTISGLPDRMFFNEDLPPSLVNDYAKASLILKRMKALDEQKRYKIAFLLIPVKEQISERKRNEFVAVDPTYRSQFDFSKPYADTKKIIEEQNITVIDTLPVFLAHEKDNSFYYEQDGHWNQDGHNLAASILRTYIEQQLTNTPAPKAQN